MFSVQRTSLAICAVFAVLLMPLSIYADELYLSDGRVIEGEIISQPDADVIDIRIGAGTLVAIQHFPRRQVERVIYRVSQKQVALKELHLRLAELTYRSDVTIEQWWTMARSFLDHGDQAGAKVAAERVVALDRHHVEAQKLLGMVKYRGVWMRPREAALARGEVFFGGQWVTWAQKEQTLADEALRREEAIAAREERAERQRQNRLAAASVQASSNYLSETYAGGYYSSPYYNSSGSWLYNGRYPGYANYGTQCIRPPISVNGCSSSGYGWHFGASGGSSSFSWGFNWRGGSRDGTCNQLIR